MDYRAKRNIFYADSFFILKIVINDTPSNFIDFPFGLRFIITKGYVRINFCGDFCEFLIAPTFFIVF